MMQRVNSSIRKLNAINAIAMNQVKTWEFIDAFSKYLRNNTALHIAGACITTLNIGCTSSMISSQNSTWKAFNRMPPQDTTSVNNLQHETASTKNESEEQLP